METITVEKMKEEIIAAVNAKKFSAMKLEPSRKGASISHIKQGKMVTDSKVIEIYETLCSLQSKESAITENNRTSVIFCYC